MPVHNWSKVDANLFHHFHQQWSIAICNSLNAGLLPNGYSALIEQHARGLVPDVLTVERQVKERDQSSGGLLLATPPRTKHVVRGKKDMLAERANQVVIRHQLGEIVSMIEIVSPGNKSSTGAFRKFIEKTQEFLEAGVSLLIIDLFPPGKRDPQGIHRAIWEEVYQEDDFENPQEKPLTLASYVPGDSMMTRSPKAYVEPIGYGDLLPEMLAYLDDKFYVPVPLEKTYQLSWDVSPVALRELVEKSGV